MSEAQRVRERYERRRGRRKPGRYSPLAPAVYLTVQELERALIRWLVSCELPAAPKHLRVLEVGCGGGAQLLQLIRLGFDPHNLVGVELLEERATSARERLPSSVAVICADAAETDYEGSFDVVLQATVFTSLLDTAFQRRLATRMWEVVRPGGGVLWYDFVYDNPSNPDVRGISVRRIRELFPEATIRAWRVTLAPPLARRVTKIHPGLYTVLNSLSFLRTHVLCWAQKRPTA